MYLYLEEFDMIIWYNINLPVPVHHELHPQDVDQLSLNLT